MLVPVVGATVFGLLMAVNAGAMPTHTDPTRGEHGQARALYWQDLIATAEWLRENTPADAVILCSQAPILSYLSRRRAYTYRFQRSQDPLTKYDIDYVAMDGPRSAALDELVRQRSGSTWTIPTRFAIQGIRISRIRKPDGVSAPSGS